jgi:hypothetical protein
MTLLTTKIKTVPEAKAFAVLAKVIGNKLAGGQTAHGFVDALAQSTAAITAAPIQIGAALAKTAISGVGALASSAVALVTGSAKSLREAGSSAAGHARSVLGQLPSDFSSVRASASGKVTELGTAVHELREKFVQYCREHGITRNKLFIAGGTALTIYGLAVFLKWATATKNSHDAKTREAIEKLEHFQAEQMEIARKADGPSLSSEEEKKFAEVKSKMRRISLPKKSMSPRAEAVHRARAASALRARTSRKRVRGGAIPISEVATIEGGIHFVEAPLEPISGGGKRRRHK